MSTPHITTETYRIDRSTDRRITGSTDHRITGSQDHTIVPAVGTEFRPLYLFALAMRVAARNHTNKNHKNDQHKTDTYKQSNNSNTKHGDR